MRAGSCTVQQALTPEATNIVKQAVGLARGRSHAQVTPLHVATTMLSSSAGLLRTACLRSHSHPLQCKALDLCFNVALNRLPALLPNPMLGHHGRQYPSLSNALVAAFKRAQAYQRRGSVENQQQPLQSLKVEVEQLIISILDDPSVSRVMREAGFSSTQVKSNVEKAVPSFYVSASSPPTPTKTSQEENDLINMQSSKLADDCSVLGMPIEDHNKLHSQQGLLNNLSLNLSTDSDQLFSSNKKVEGGASDCSFRLDGEEKELICCSDCFRNFQREVRTIAKNSASNYDLGICFPSWLRQDKKEDKKTSINDQDYVQVCKKWNSFCTSFHKGHHQLVRKTLNFNPMASFPFTPFSFTSSEKNFSENYDQFIYQTLPINMLTSSKSNIRTASHSLEPEDLMPNTDASSNSASCDTMEIDQYLPKFKEINAQNLKALCNALEQKVPWQKEILQEMSSIILQCRSGMIRRRGKNTMTQETKEETWLFFQGTDTEGKEKIAREMASIVFGSDTNFVSIGLSSFSSARSDFSEDYGKKRSREESNSSYFGRFVSEVGANPHRVFFLENIEQLEYYSLIGIKNAIEKGFVTTSGVGEGVALRDAIVILSCETFDSRSRASSPVRQKSDQCDQGDDNGDQSHCSVVLDLNRTFVDSDEPSFDDIGLIEAVDRKFFLS